MQQINLAIFYHCIMCFTAIQQHLNWLQHATLTLKYYKFKMVNLQIVMLYSAMQ